MRSWDASRVALEAGAELTVGKRTDGPHRVSIDSRDVRSEDLFVGLVGENVDGGKFAQQALESGAWGVLVGRDSAEGLAVSNGVVLTSDDPLGSLGLLARGWRRELDCPTIGICGSVGKTSTKDILASLLATQLRVHKTPGNYNTEIGMPLTILSAPEGTQALVLEMAMRGPGQIAELTEIAEPNVGIVLNIGPEHLELLGSLEGVAAAEAEVIENLPAGATAVAPRGERLLEPHWRHRDDIAYRTFGDGGDVSVVTVESESGHGDGRHWARLSANVVGKTLELELPFSQAHQIQNTLAALAAADAVGVAPIGKVEIDFSPLRGERVVLPNSAVLINDCYNANPVSMRAALDDLAASAPARRVAVLGDMLELGDDAEEYHREIGYYAAETAVDLLLVVGSLSQEIAATFSGETHSVATADEAVALLRDLIEASDTVLVKGSRGIGLEQVAQELQIAKT